jgi:ribosome-binding ATPase YchF (GTP1/OBG family)
MSNVIDQQLRNVFLGHLLEFQVYLAKAKIMLTADDIKELKFRIILLLKDCYLVINLYEKEDKEKEKKLQKIKEIENTIVNLPLMSDSLEDIEEIYDQTIEVFNTYLFPKED